MTQVDDIFTFDPEYMYRIVLVGGVVLEGFLIDARENGIVLNRGEHIPTDMILYFIPLGKMQKDETEY